MTETSSEAILDGTLRVGSHTYATNRVVSDCRNGVLLRMTWNAKERATVDYIKGIVDVKSFRLPPCPHDKMEPNGSSAKITNLSVKNSSNVEEKITM